MIVAVRQPAPIGAGHVFELPAIARTEHVGAPPEAADLSRNDDDTPV